MEDVVGKVAFVTGGASGMGLGMAKAFVAAGMKVVIADVRQEHLDSALASFPGDAHDRVHFIRVDVTDRPGMEKAAAEVVHVFGKVNVLCNNAGIGVIGHIKDSTYDDWDWMLAVNLTGVFNGVHAFLPHIRASGEGGHIVNTSSAGGLFTADNGGPYSTAKFGVVAMTQCLRWDLEAENIGASVLCPGGVRTNIHKTIDLRPEKYQTSGYKPGEVVAGQSPEEAEAQRKAMAAMFMDPDDVGRMVLDAIRRNDLYILPQPFTPIIMARRDAILGSLPDEPVNQARLQADLMSRTLRLRPAGPA